MRPSLDEIYQETGIGQRPSLDELFAQSTAVRPSLDSIYQELSSPSESQLSADTGTALSHGQLPAGSGGLTIGAQAAGSPRPLNKAEFARMENEPWAFGSGVVASGPVDVRKHHLPQEGGKSLVRRVMGDDSNTARMIENIIPSAARLAGDTAGMAYDGTEQLLALFTQLMPDGVGGDWARRKLFEPGKGLGWASRDIINNPGRAADDLGKVGQSLKRYYWDEGVKPIFEFRLGESAIEDPVGFWFDIGGAVAGGGAGLAKAGSRAAKRWPRLVPTKSNLQQTYGRLSEAIGPANYDIIQRNKSEQALAAGRVATETAGYTLKPWVQVMLESIPYMGTNEFGVSRALIMGDKLKNAVNSIPKVGETIAKRLGLSRGQLEELSRIAEAIPAKPQDRYGYMRLGILESGKDGEKYWKHGLDPETLRETVAGLPPDAQKLLLAYIEPKNGWDGPPWLPEKGMAGVNHGEAALKRLAELSGTDERTIIFNRSMHGRNFVNAIAGQDPAKRRLAEVARIYLDTEGRGKHGDWKIVDPNAGAGWGRVPPDKLQDAAQLQGQEAGPGAGVNLAEEPVRPGMGRIVSEGLAPARPGRVANISENVSREINALGFEGAPSAVTIEPQGLKHIMERHGNQLTGRDWTMLRKTIDEPHEVLPNLPSERSPGREQSVLLVRHQDKSYVSIVEITPGADDNRLWNFWKMSPKKAESYLKKFREEKARRVQPGGATLSPMFLPPEGGGKPEGLSGRQAAATGLKESIDSGRDIVKGSVDGSKKDFTADLMGLQQAYEAVADAVQKRLSPRRAPVPEGEHWLNVPGRSSREKPGTLSRERAFEDLVEAGVLEPRQHLEGYVTHMGTSPKAAEAARLKKSAPELELSPITPGMARERLEGLSAAPPLDKAITAYGTAAEEAKLQRAMLAELGPRLLTPVAPEERFINGQLQLVPGRVRPENMVRTVSEWDPWAKKEVTRQEPLTLVEVGAEEAAALGMEPGRYTIPEPFAERFNVLMGRAVSGKLDTPIEGFNQFVRDTFRYWKANVLVSFGTAVTNLIGGGTQYMGKVLEDLFRGELRKVGHDLAAPVRALSPKAVKALPPEVLGTNIATQFSESTGIFFKAVQDRLKAGEHVSLPKRVAGRLNQAFGLGLNLALKPFGMIDNFWKRAIYLSELETWARREARRMVKEGKAPAGRVSELAEELAVGAFQKRPDLHKEIMQGPVDVFAYDYDNIPIGLQKFRESTTGAATMPFPVFPYKYLRMLGRQANAFNPFSELPLKERIARGGSLIGSVAGPEYLRRKLAGGESQVEADLDRFREEYPDTETQVAYPYLGGREYVGSSTGPDGKPKEHWLRTAKYGYLNLPKAFKSYEDFLSFADEFKTTGPAVAIGANLLGMVPRQFGPRDLPGQIGELVSGLIPAHRVVEFVAKVNDDFKRRLPRGFWEEILVKFPGGREFIHQPMDRWNRKLAQDNRLEEWLKFLSGVNLKTVDVAAAKEAMSEAVARASDRGMDDGTRLTIYARWSGLEPEKIEPYLKKIKQAEGNALLAYRKVEHNVFYQALIRGLEAMDPVNAAEITDLKRRAGREVVTHGFKGAGLRNQADVRQALRIAAGLEWIREHLGKEAVK